MAARSREGVAAAALDERSGERETDEGAGPIG
jgi:hypothetical protein